MYYIHTDALGSPVAETDANRNVVKRYEYEPYGRRLNLGNDDKPGYTGHVMDAVTGLVQMQQRYYDPGIGAMLSVDPVTAYEQPITNFCRYCYARNNPYKFTDPDGRQSESVMDRRYVYSRLNSEQVAGIEAQHNEIGGQAAKGMAIGAAGATIGVVAVKSGAVAATVSAAGGAADAVGKAALVAEAKYAAGGVTAVVAGQRVVQAVANQAITIEVAVKTSPVTTTALQHVDKAMDAVQGFVVPGPPPMTPAGVTGGFAQEMQKEIEP